MIEINPVRKTLLSSLVVKMTYFYFDPTTNDWDSSDKPPTDPTNSEYILPDFVRLTFDIEGKISNITVPMPAATVGSATTGNTTTTTTGAAASGNSTSSSPVPIY